jgi:hypothetical protein
MTTYDIVLLPEKTLNKASVKLSQQLESLGTDFTLGETNRYPHLSLYMANFTPGNVNTVRERLRVIAKMASNGHHRTT